MAKKKTGKVVALRPRGHPPLLVFDAKTRKALTKLSEIQCTLREAAAVLGVTAPSLHAWFAREPKARELWENGQLSGRQSLRRFQFNTAKKNPTMQIWLGKNWLNQKDRQEQDVNVRVTTTDPLRDINAELDAIRDRQVGTSNGNTDNRPEGEESSRGSRSLH